MWRSTKSIAVLHLGLTPRRKCDVFLIFFWGHPKLFYTGSLFSSPAERGAVEPFPRNARGFLLERVTSMNSCFREEYRGLRIAPLSVALDECCSQENRSNPNTCTRAWFSGDPRLRASHVEVKHRGMVGRHVEIVSLGWNPQGWVSFLQSPLDRQSRAIDPTPV